MAAETTIPEANHIEISAEADTATAEQSAAPVTNEQPAASVSEPASNEQAVDDATGNADANDAKSSVKSNADANSSDASNPSEPAGKDVLSSEQSQEAGKNAGKDQKAPQQEAPSTPSVKKRSTTHKKVNQPTNVVTESKMPESPATGDTSNLYLWFLSMIASFGVCMTSLIHFGKKKSSRFHD